MGDLVRTAQLHLPLLLCSFYIEIGYQSLVDKLALKWEEKVCLFNLKIHPNNPEIIRYIITRPKPNLRKALFHVW